MYVHGSGGSVTIRIVAVDCVENRQIVVKWHILQYAQNGSGMYGSHHVSCVLLVCSPVFGLIQKLFPHEWNGMWVVYVMSAKWAPLAVF